MLKEEKHTMPLKQIQVAHIDTNLSPSKDLSLILADPQMTTYYSLVKNTLVYSQLTTYYSLVKNTLMYSHMTTYYSLVKNTLVYSHMTTYNSFFLQIYFI